MGQDLLGFLEEEGSMKRPQTGIHVPKLSGANCPLLESRAHLPACTPGRALGPLEAVHGRCCISCMNFNLRSLFFLSHPSLDES